MPIRSPTVTTMRFQPTIVPMPRAMATATLTHRGMKRVASSTCFLKASSLALVSASKLPTLSLSIRRMASEARYMSLRTFAMASAGTRDREP
ncbi:hypothetical protein D9M69_616230 [compost metagenome]